MRRPLSLLIGSCLTAGVLAVPAFAETSECPAVKEIRIDDPQPDSYGLTWAIASLFLPYAEEHGLMMRVDQGWPDARVVHFDRASSPSLEGDKLIMRWGGVIEFKDKDEVAFSIGKPRIELTSQESADLYLTFVDGGEETEVRFGTVTGPFYVAEDENGGYEVLRAENAPVILDPAAVGVLPGLSAETEIPPLSVLFPFYDRSNPEGAEFYKQVWNLSKSCPALPWMTTWAVKSPQAPKPPSEPIRPDIPSVEEENQHWNDKEVPAAQKQLLWGIKNSWVGYAGGGEQEGVGYDAGSRSYTFPVVSATPELVQFSGAIHWVKYGGILDLYFGEPQLRIADDGTSVLWLKDMHKGEYFPAVRVDGKVSVENGSLALTNAPTYLTSELSDYFINAYRPGLRMSNLSFQAAVTGGSQPTPTPTPTPESTPTPTPDPTVSPTPAPHPDKPGEEVSVPSPAPKKPERGGLLSMLSASFMRILGGIGPILLGFLAGAFGWWWMSQR